MHKSVWSTAHILFRDPFNFDTADKMQTSTHKAHLPIISPPIYDFIDQRQDRGFFLLSNSLFSYFGRGNTRLGRNISSRTRQHPQVSKTKLWRGMCLFPDSEGLTVTLGFSMTLATSWFIVLMTTCFNRLVAQGIKTNVPLRH